MKIGKYIDPDAYKRFWTRFWMRYAGLGPMGRLATRLATWYAPPHKARGPLANMNLNGFIEPDAVIYHSDIRFGKHPFIGNRVIIYQAKDGGPVTLGNRIYIYRDAVLETGYGGCLSLGDHSSIHPRCQLNAYLKPITIGRGVMIAPNCALYSYNHGIAPDVPIREQPLVSKGEIVIGDEAWLSVGVTVLSGVRIGNHAVIGAGSVVTSDIPDNALAMGVPAKVVKMRNDIDS